MEDVNPLRRILANAGWLTGGRIAADIANLALFVVLARTFGPDGLGQYAYAFGIATLIYAAVNLGLEEYGVRECARTPSDGLGVLMGRLLVIQAGALVVCVSLLSLLLVLTERSLVGVILIGSLVLQQVFFAFSRTFLSPAFAKQKMSVPAVAEFLTRLLGVGGSLALIGIFSTGLGVSLIPLAASAFLFLAYAVRSCLSECPKIVWSVQWEQLRPIVSQAWPFAGSLFLDIAAIRSNFIILNIMLGASETGIYASGVKFMEAAAIPLGFLGFAAYPRLSHLYQFDRSEFWNAGEKLVRVAVFVGILISWGLLFVAPLIVGPLLGAKFVESAPIIRWLSGMGFLTSLSFILSRLLMASDRQRARLIIQAFSFAVLLLTTILAIPFLGIYGAILGLYVSAVTRAVVTTIVLGADFTTKLVRIVVLLILAISVSAGLTFVVDHVLNSIIWTTIVSLATFLLAVVWLRVLPNPLALRKDFGGR